MKCETLNRKDTLVMFHNRSIVPLPKQAVKHDHAIIARISGETLTDYGTKYQKLAI